MLPAPPLQGNVRLRSRQQASSLARNGRAANAQRAADFAATVLPRPPAQNAFSESYRRKMPVACCRSIAAVCHAACFPSIFPMLTADFSSPSLTPLRFSSPALPAIFVAWPRLSPHAGERMRAAEARRDAAPLMLMLLLRRQRRATLPPPRC